MPLRYVLLLLLLPVQLFAKDVIKTANTATKPLSFIQNAGQITDQHGKYRGDIDVKLETPGMAVFVGDGAIHYQWAVEKVKSKNEKVNPCAGKLLPLPASKEEFIYQKTPSIYEYAQSCMR